MYLAGNLKMSLLNFSFAMILRVHKMSVLISMFSISIVGMNYLKDNIFECFFKRYNRVSISFFITYNDGKFKASRGKPN